MNKPLVEALNKFTYIIIIISAQIQITEQDIRFVGINIRGDLDIGKRTEA